MSNKSKLADIGAALAFFLLMVCCMMLEKS